VALNTPKGQAAEFFAKRAAELTKGNAGALSAVPLAALAQQPIVIKFSHVVALNTPKGQAAEFFPSAPRN